MTLSLLYMDIGQGLIYVPSCVGHKITQYLREKWPHVLSSSSQLYRTHPGPMMRNGPRQRGSSRTAAVSDCCKQTPANTVQ